MQAGTRIGPYEIVAAIGAGGMGEVYRARDTKLNRDVAVKILPGAFANDADRLHRFTREAQTLASLNHPHIAAIYGLEESSGVNALVMELIEGADLSKRLAQGPISIEEALPIARQIAEALEAAHERGIIHRDLKPSNIKLTPDGNVKLLDFGLAKAFAGDTSTPRDVSLSPTRSQLPMTEEGVILGTVAYMSPEQAKGKSVDKRTDIWAFGVVLFEMLTGRQLFQGETVSDVLVAVLTREPEWSSLPASLPQSTRDLLHRCLERDPSLRLRDIGEARIALARKDEPRPQQPAASGTAPRRGGYLAWTLLLLLLAGAAGFFAGKFNARSMAPAADELHPETFSLLTDQPGVESEPSLSPDGRDLAYVKENNGQLDIYVVRVGGRNAINITADSPADDMDPAFSPDGQSIAFRSDRDNGGIYIVGSTGESWRRVSDMGYNPSWSPDGKKLAVGSSMFVYPQDRPATSSLWIVDIASGNKQQLTPDGADAIQPAWSPHGYRIAYWGLRAGSGRRDIWTIVADGSESKTGGIAVTDDTDLDWSPAWSPDGRYLYFSSNRGGTLNLWRVAIDEKSGKTLSAPQPVTVPSGWAGDPTFSRDGKKMAYSSLEWRSRLQKLSIDPATGKVLSQPISMLESSNPIRDHSISPDGKWIAFDAFAGANEDLFVMGSDGKNLRRLTDDPPRDRSPIWTPDGSRMTFYSDRSGRYELWSIGMDGGGLQQLTHNGKATNIPVYSPDGSQIAASNTGREGWGVLDVSRPDTLQKMPEVDAGTRFWPHSWSPDGRWISGEIMRPDGTPKGIAIFNVPEKRFQRLNVQPRGLWVLTAWLSDSSRLLFRDRRGIYFMDPATNNATQLVSVGGYCIGRSLSVTADSRTITYTETATEGDIWMTQQ